ncbi:MAG TPA: SMP-30/gluconolactonase/LRE family protein [Polyangia bacterium]|nr:SMP-30/gluconolactonase/LRE family protein [Polyangia bacterium]
MSFSLLNAAVFATVAALAPARAPMDPPLGRADAVVDLATREGTALVQASWRYHDAELVAIDGRGPGADLKPSGKRLRTHDVVPHAGAVDFDDRGWEVIDPTTLEQRRGTGRVSFAWYRLNVTVPERFGALEATGTTVALEVVLDDYAEIWVDGKLPTVLGQNGGNVVKGWGSPNRVILGRDVRPGQRFQIAIFGMNGPVSASPQNFIWIKSATLDVHRGPGAVAARDPGGKVTRLSPALDEIVPREPRLEKLAEGFLFTEGPVWHPGGYLLFSDPNANAIYRFSPDGDLSVYRTKSGYRGLDIGAYEQPGSNGLALDPQQGRLTINEHGNRRVTRLARNGVLSVLADRYDGKRLNSPNDLVYRSDGTLYFTDPPFGLPKAFDDPRKELPYSGVYAVTPDGQVKLVARELTGPNGLAFSPDEKYLYVDNWDVARKVIMRYEVAPDGGLGNGVVFLDLTKVPGEQAFDGLKVDQKGNVYAAGPGGLLVISPSGQVLGTLQFSEQPANLAWGDADRRTLYVTARTGLYRVFLNIPGAGTAVAPSPLAGK